MKTPLPRFKSPEACAAWLRANGVNVSQLARDNGLPRVDVQPNLTRFGV